jgi:hypothetical protein
MLWSVLFEKKNGKWQLSIGRLFFWMVCIPAVWVLLPFTTGGYQDIGSNHMVLIGFALTYNLGKKGWRTWGYVSGVQNGKTAEDRVADQVLHPKERSKYLSANIGDPSIG